jgi:hypothetical protein
MAEKPFQGEDLTMAALQLRKALLKAPGERF